MYEPFRTGDIDLVDLPTVTALAAHRAPVCVSMCLPTHPAGPATEQDPIRLKNLLRAADDVLRSQHGIARRDAAELLEPAAALASDRDFWRHQSDGLALYLAPGMLRALRVPLPLDESLQVGASFRLRPLLRLLSGDGHFYVLALAQNEVRLFEGTRFTMGELTLGPIPPDMETALAHEDPEAQLQVRAGGQAGMFHGHGEGAEVDKQTLERFFRVVDRALRSRLGPDRHPLVLACVGYYLPIFRSVSSYDGLADDCIAGSPEGRPVHVLQQQAWDIVGPLFEAARRVAEERLRAAVGVGRAAVGAADVVVAAYAGQVATLFLADDDPCWGRLTPSSAPEVHEAPENGDEDLLETAARTALTTNGDVYLDAADVVPEGARAAALLRW
jgi:hypothetical protein